MRTPTPPFTEVPVLEGGLGTLPEERPAEAETPPADAALWAIVLAGGIGSRFWPLSSRERPKQLLALVCERPLIAETVARLQPLVPPERVLVLTSRDIAERLHAAIPEVPQGNMLIEPRPLGTAAALAWGAFEISKRAGPDTLLTTIHADLAIGFPDAFRNVLQYSSRTAARDEVLVTVGVHATRPETGFGYIRPGPALGKDALLGPAEARRVAQFIEKPDAEQAQRLVKEGALWNSGIFVWRARVVLDALRRHARELSDGFAALEARDFDRFASSIESVSIERGLLERSDNLVVVPGEFQWDDVGTWASLRRARELDDDGNGAIGKAHFVDASSNVVHADGSSVVLYGVNGLLVVSIKGMTFVTTLERATDLRPLLDQLPEEVRRRRGS
jgi:mannose-1-phosphate guanylyltransferase